MTNVELKQEQERVRDVMALLARRIDAVQEQAGGRKDDIRDIRKHFWSDVRINMDDDIEKAETFYSIKQQAELLSDKERSYRQTLKQLGVLTKLQQSPYFGRIDFTETGAKSAERIYIGIGSLLAEDGLDFLIYDWRAPVSSLYYDYLPGPAQYETPGGVIRGTMELKRQFVIQGGRIESMFDSGVTIGDELLRQVLGRGSDAQMKSIVATIQQEQNRIIRNERSRLLVVHGPAGSGKTSAALQRVAYLLYRYRESLRSDQIVLFSPNTLFNSYVATVLPELGEENMQQTTFEEYLAYRLGDDFQLETMGEQMEYVLTAMNEPGYAEWLEAIRYKSTAPFMAEIERYVRSLGSEGMPFRDIVFRGEVLIESGRIAQHFYALDSALAVPDRIRLVAEWLLQELKAKAREEMSKPWVEDEVELLDEEAYLEAYSKLRRGKRYTENTFDDFEREREELARGVVLEHFQPLRQEVKKLRFVDVPALYRRLAADFDGVRLASEDATPYLYLKDCVEGFRTNHAVHHVFIDEAQDYSPFQFAFVRRMFPRARFTVLGDPNQAIYGHAAAGEGADALSALSGGGGSGGSAGEEAETIALTRTYRSTKQIVELTRRLIAGGEAIVPFNREGPLPTVRRAADSDELAAIAAALIRALQQRGRKTIAVIAKTAAECREAYEALQAHVPVRLIGSDTAAFEAGAMVIPSYMAKGVEFDAVIVFDASEQQYGRESERKLFYTVCTRAMHELHILYAGEWSPFLAAVPPHLYVAE